jgi:hypothetical protein
VQTTVKHAHTPLASTPEISKPKTYVQGRKNTEIFFSSSFPLRQEEELYWTSVGNIIITIVIIVIVIKKAINQEKRKYTQRCPGQGQGSDYTLPLGTFFYSCFISFPHSTGMGREKPGLEHL